jgi:hypothetical protein
MTYLNTVMYSYVQVQLYGREGGRGECIGLQFDGVVIRPTCRKNVRIAIAVCNGPCTVYNVEGKKGAMELVATFDI